MKVVSITGKYVESKRLPVARIRAWDESQHPREPAGTSIGGRFASSDSGEDDNKEIWKQSKEEYVGKWPEKPTEEDYKRLRNREHDWAFAVKQAVSEGKLSPKEARDQGLYSPGLPDLMGSGEGNWAPLPEGDLYHVTTALDSVQANGLKSREELQMSAGVGLGGGDNQTISFTDDRDIAEAIYKGVKEARGVARNDITFEDLIDTADKGKDAPRPYLTNIIRSGGTNVIDAFVEPADLSKWKPGDALPLGLQEAIKGREIVKKPFSEWKISGRGYKPEDIPEGGTPIGKLENGMYPGYSRKATPERLQELRFDFYTKFSFHRDYAGGGKDPLFIFNDVPALAKTRESDIALLTYKAKPGTYGYRVGGLKEWRTFSGKTVTLKSSKDLAGVVIKYVETQ